ncbi:hypothetical protein [Priestia megaterium]|uniref:hypothetical protein n=1 Tax=Priestia megaterium TaxID=1404 RepID=UPI001BE5AD15|nr:hypothetical protein [Priestia megaterium]
MIINKIRNQGYLFLLSGNIIFTINQFCVLILLNRTGDLSLVGTYSLYLSIVSPISMLANLKLKSYILANKDKRNVLLSFRLLFSLIVDVFFIVVVVGFILSGFLELYNGLLLVFILLIKSIENKSEAYNAKVQIDLGIKVAGQLVFIKNILILTSFVVSFLLTQSILISLFLWFLISFIFFRYVEKRRGEVINIDSKFTFSDLKKYLLVLIPLGIAQFFISINANVPRYFLNSFGTLTEVGLFSTLSYFAIATNVIATTIQQIFIPRIEEKLRNEAVPSNRKKIVKQMFFLLLSILFLGWISISLISIKIIPLILGNDYSEYIFEFSILLAATFIIYIGWFLDVILLIVNRLTIIRKAEILRGITIIVICLIFIVNDKFDMTYAVYSLFFASLLQMIFKLFFSFKYI